jgi:SAM-dependent methyltransferase
VNAETKKAIARIESANWWVLARLGIMRFLVDRYLEGRTGRNIDVGSGTGFVGFSLFGAGTCFGIDREKDLVFEYRQRMRGATTANAEMLPFRSNAFRFAFCLDVLEHLERDADAILEIRRVLERQGVCIFSVPLHPCLWGSEDENAGHVRRYTAAVKGLLGGILEIRDVVHWNSWLFLPLWCLRFLEKTREHFRPRAPKPSAPSHDPLQIIYAESIHPNKLLNFILRTASGIEACLIRAGVRIPLGVSCFVVCRKRE